MEKTLHKWYEESFGKDYLLIYRHRDRRQAEKEVFRMMEWLKLPTQGKILDLCCGMGRHAMSLARAGYRVTGVDLSSELLQEARASDPNELVNWVECDMRALPENKMFKERFDAVVNLFTSFGYFEEDSEQLTVLRQIHKALKPGGRFIIDYMNAEYTTDHLVPFSERVEEGNLISETRRILSGFVMKEIVVQGTNHLTRRYSERVKLYGPEKLEDMLKKVGLTLDIIYGSYDGQHYDKRHSPRMIMVGHRKESVV